MAEAAETTTIGDRIRECARRVGSIEELGKLSGVPRRSLEDYIAGISEMKAGRLFVIAQAAGVSPVWLQTGEGAVDASEFAQQSSRMRGDETYAEAAGIHLDDRGGVSMWDSAPGARTPSRVVAERLVDEFVFVPRLNVQLSAGNGQPNVQESADRILAFRRDWVAQELRVPAHRLRAVTVTGDSMEDHLADGDVVLISLGDSEVRNDGVYAFRMGDDLYIKRLQRRPGGVLVAHSDNRRYDPFELPQNEGVEIIGRALWSGGKL